MSRITREQLAVVMKGRQCRLCVPGTQESLSIPISDQWCEWIRSDLHGQVMIHINEKSLWIQGNEDGLYEPCIRDETVE